MRIVCALLSLTFALAPVAAQEVESDVPVRVLDLQALQCPVGEHLLQQRRLVAGNLVVVAAYVGERIVAQQQERRAVRVEPRHAIGDLGAHPEATDPVREDLLVTEFDERNPSISPDGAWFAYQSNASGMDEIYVRPFSDPDSARHQISTTGGTNPLWSPDGNELFYVSAGRLFAV